MKPALQHLLDLLDLEYIEENIFRGQNRDLGGGRVFGGQVLAQALVAAYRTVEAGRRCHSLHAYFILPGDLAAPVVYDVDRIRDGGSFTTRRIRAIQHGRPIFNMAASFQREEEGHSHQDERPAAEGPDGLRSEIELIREIADLIPEKLRPIYTQDRPFEFRPTDPVNPWAPEERAPRHAVWFRAVDRLPDTPWAHQALLAYASDHGLLPTALRPHKLSFLQRGLQIASLDHALWIHRPFRVDEWLLYVMESPNAGGARGFARGSIYTEAGTLVASVAQEGLMRLRVP
ncbi:MAG: acyl-CoA thioesterase II [Rhodothermales bacterium]|nr:acyl-CoA thioesterase II [Rhodothermales bacterium]